MEFNFSKNASMRSGTTDGCGRWGLYFYYIQDWLGSLQVRVGGHVDFHQPQRYWDFKSVGRGNIHFEKVIRALNDIGYAGPLSVEWEDGGMDREFGATESCAYVKKLNFPPSQIIFDAQFAKNHQP